MKRLSFLFLLVACFSLSAVAEEDGNKVILQGKIVDSKNKKAQEFASVYLHNPEKNYSALTDENGLFLIRNIHPGSYKLIVSYIGYDKYEKELTLSNDTSLYEISLSSSRTILEEVIVTAVESRGITSSTIIDRQAMEHLQPSSFTDLLELLPGGKAIDPKLTESNTMTVREPGRSGSEYNIASLGTSFLIDGIPLSVNSDMQYTTGNEMSINGGYSNSSRATVDKGIDMRSISTDQIERVEIVRGVASVRFGDLTSGLVKIERKKGESPLEARVKVDQLSKLFYVGKGFKINDIILNAGLDFLDAKETPTNNVENYQRLNASLRLNSNIEKEKYRLQWNSSLDLAHTLDDEKTDPDKGYNLVDRYKSSHSRFGWSNSLAWIFKESSFTKRLELSTQASYSLNKIEQTKLTQINAPTAIPNSTEQGVSDGIYLPGNWISELTVDGKPLFLYAQLNGIFSLQTGGIVHKIQAGSEWRLEKNLGNGQVYDVTRPPSPNMSTRPRKYSDIQAEKTLSFYLEDVVGIKLNEHYLKLSAGIRANTLLGLESAYKMSGKFYFDPRFNAQWTFPSIEIKDRPLQLSLTAGLGWQSKNPTMHQLFPDWAYSDIVQLNYYHNNPEYRRINIMTYKKKTINYNLEPSRNRKWEVNFNAHYNNNNFFITFYKENMNNGFRPQGMETAFLEYTKYDPNSIDPDVLTAPPRLEDFASSLDTLSTIYSATTNGTSIKKHGIEFAFSSKRIELIKTRITFNGAWNYTTYGNSSLAYKKAQRTVNGVFIKEVGVYDSDGGEMRFESLNTNLMFDTYVPIIDFIFSTSLQCSWFDSKQTLRYSGMPIAYIDKNGEMQTYTEAELNDIYLGTLYNPVSEGQFKKQKIPFGMNVNFKMSKKFKDKINVSVFVNRLFDYHPDYTVNGFTYHRNVSPYFGAEINLTL